MGIMRVLFAVLLMPLVLVSLAACENADRIEITDVYAYDTPQTNPAAAIFMTVRNRTGETDRMIDFKTDAGERTELHTMETDGDIMRMRRVDGYDYPSTWDNIVYSLSPMGDHIMVFGLRRDLMAGDKFDGVAVFEKSGEIPVTVTVKSRKNEGDTPDFGDMTHDHDDMHDSHNHHH